MTKLPPLQPLNLTQMYAKQARQHGCGNYGMGKTIEKEYKKDRHKFIEHTKWRMKQKNNKMDFEFLDL